MDSQRNKQLSDLRRQIVSYFDKDELKLVTFELAVNWDDLSGDKVSSKAQSLVVQADQTGKLNELIAILSKERPHVTWTKISESGQSPSPIEEDTVRTAVWNALYRTLWKQKTLLNSHKGRPPLIDKFSFSLWADYLNRPVDSRPEESELILKDIRSYLFSCTEDEFYSCLEFILNYWNDLNHYSPKPINQAVNAALKREKAGRQYKPTYQYSHFESGAIVVEDE